MDPAGTDDPRLPRTGPAPAAPESVVTLCGPADRVLARWLCTPSRLEDLAAGWLVCEGLVRARGDILRLEVRGGADVRAELAAPALARVHGARDRREPGPAPRDLVASGPAASPRADPDLAGLLDDPLRLQALFAEAFARATLREEVGGGVHTGARVERGTVVDVVEDVSRSAVVDKLVGAAFRAGASAGTTGALYLLSGRISGTIAAKLARAGVAAAATISIPTTLAVEIAARSGVLLVGRARRGRPWRYGVSP
jgi:FdhD protein